MPGGHDALSSTPSTTNDIITMAKTLRKMLYKILEENIMHSKISIHLQRKDTSRLEVNTHWLTVRAKTLYKF
jgi:hypothetical protein